MPGGCVSGVIERRYSLSEDGECGGVTGSAAGDGCDYAVDSEKSSGFDGGGVGHNDELPPRLVVSCTDGRGSSRS